jgi:hypothetical protein
MKNEDISSPINSFGPIIFVGTDIHRLSDVRCRGPIII